MNHENAQRLRVATYNVHGCVGMDGKRSESRIAEVIASLSVDIVGLQELDHNRARSAAIDQAGTIAKQLGWHHFFHPAMRRTEELYGDAILSRYPITVRHAVELPGFAPWYCRETRGVTWAEAATPLGPVHIINTHFGLGRRERLLQARLLTSPEWLGAVTPDTAVIVLGDFNSLPWSPAYRMIESQLRDVRRVIASAWSFRTFPTLFPVLAVDHIFATPALTPTSMSVYRSGHARIASDHFPLVADFARSSRS
ncbi:MAG: endonuclease/exonuclease/phosphatase family protein [Chthoniobacterales bacterium]|nr:endonuclease/exonuclease/phosphatase family protein [Chthoniobacterales bacterium]